MSNLLLQKIPTVGYMGHKPTYREPIINIGSLGIHHFDLSSTKAEFNPASTKTLSKGFATAFNFNDDKNIPVVGYRGFMPGMKARNFHGKPFRECRNRSPSLN